MGLHGPRIVWIFSNPGDLINIPDTEGCTQENRKEFELGLFYNFIEVYDIENWPLSMGLTGGEYVQLASQRIDNFSTNPFKSFAHTCFDTISGLVYLVDAVEKRLQSEGTSIRHLVADKGEVKALEKSIVKAIYDIDVNLYTGRAKYESDNQRVVIGSGYWQSQTNGRVVVFHDSANSKDPDRYKYPSKIIWKTPNGDIPRDKPRVIKLEAKVNIVVAVIYSCIAIGLSIVLMLESAVKFNNCKENKAYIITIVGHIGLILIQILAFIFPWTARFQFCQAAPILAGYGFFLLFWSIFIRLRAKEQRTHEALKPLGLSSNSKASKTRLSAFTPRPSAFSQGNASITTVRSSSVVPQGPKDIILNKSYWITLVFTLILLFVVIFLWYYLAAVPTTKSVSYQTYDYITDTVTNEETENCASIGNEVLVYIFAGALAIILGFFLLAVAALAISKRSGHNELTKNTVLCAYCVVPTMFAGLLLIAIGLDMNMTYYILVPIVQIKTIGLFFLAKAQI